MAAHARKGRAGSGGVRGPRVIAGDRSGLRLVVPKGTGTRPTTDRVKESLFAALGPGRIDGARVLDGYAGTGALAIEALSRGAAEAAIVDRDPRAIDAIRRNLTTTGLADRAQLQRRGFASLLAGVTPDDPFDLVFLDPPYDQSNAELGRVLELLAAPGWLHEQATVVIERAASAGPPPLPDGWGVSWERVYGDTLILLVGPVSGLDAGDPSS